MTRTMCTARRQRNGNPFHDGEAVEGPSVEGEMPTEEERLHLKARAGPQGRRRCWVRAENSFTMKKAWKVHLSRCRRSSW